MDPLSAIGLTAGIIAILQLTAALIEPATSSLGPSKDDKEELKRLHTVMIGFIIAYNNLEEYLKSNPGAADTLAAAIQQPIKECKGVLTEVRKRLEKMTIVRTHILGKKWDKEYQRLVQRLEVARQLFDVILQGDQSKRLIRISQFEAQQSADIGLIQGDVQNAGKRLEEIQLNAKTNQQNIEMQAAKNQSDLRLIMEGHQDKIDTQFLRIEKQEQRKSKDKILRWLTTTDPTSNHDRAYKSHIAGTGNWFIKGQDYLDWLTRPKSFFWLNGKAGCGKTVLSSTIIKNTDIYCDENEGYVMAYFYFSFTDPANQQCSNMLSSLLAQLAAQVDITPCCLESLHNTYTSTPPVKALRNALQTLIDDMPFLQVYLVVDALDEIPDTSGREEACQLLEMLSQNSKTHVLVTSRREHDIMESISGYGSVNDISIQNPEVDRDIEVYVREQLNKDKKLKKWSALHNEIKGVLNSKADGMFRWAACQLDTLRKCPSVDKVQKALENLPRTLDETYERILLNTDKNCMDIIVEALRWLCYSTEILTIEKLCVAAAFSANVEPPSEMAPLETSFNTNAFFQDPLDILELLSGLVICLPPGGADDTKDLRGNQDTNLVPLEPQPATIKANWKIQLSHFSVKEYLTSGRLNPKVDQFSIAAESSHAALATNCIYFILYFLAQEDTKYPEQHVVRSKVYEQNPFLEYASKNWRTHVTEAKDDLRLGHLIVSVLEARHKQKKYFFEVLHWRESAVEALQPLYLASCLQLLWPCNILLRNGANVNWKNGRFGSALQAAVDNNNESIVQLLLDYRADVNNQGGAEGSALEVASYRGNESIILLLLRYGADINIKSESYGAPLLAAIAGYNASTVQTLVGCGADVNIQAGPMESPLQLASFCAQESIVELLLEHGADFNKQGGTYGSALQAASYRGSDSIVSLLLGRGADVNIRGGKYETALQAASYYGKESTVSILLAHGADVHIQGGLHGSALQAASSQGQEGIIRLLLAHGADVNMQGEEASALQVARDKLDIVQLLLGHGAEVSSRPGYYRDMIDLSLMRRKPEIPILLLERGAVMWWYDGGVEADEALAKKDFKTFVAIQLKSGAKGGSPKGGSSEGGNDYMEKGKGNGAGVGKEKVNVD